MRLIPSHMYGWVMKHTASRKISINGPGEAKRQFPPASAQSSFRTDTKDTTAMKTYCVINGESGCHAAAGRVDVKMNWLCGIFSFEEEQLGDN